MAIKVRRDLDWAKCMKDRDVVPSSEAEAVRHATSLLGEHGGPAAHRLAAKFARYAAMDRDSYRELLYQRVLEMIEQRAGAEGRL